MPPDSDAWCVMATMGLAAEDSCLGIYSPHCCSVEVIGLEAQLQSHPEASCMSGAHVVSVVCPFPVRYSTKGSEAKL